MYMYYCYVYRARPNRKLRRLEGRYSLLVHIDLECTGKVLDHSNMHTHTVTGWTEL